MNCRRLFFAILTAFVLAGCSSLKDVLYFQNIDKASLRPLAQEYEAVIKKDDRLIIVVSGPDKTVTSPYNLTLAENGYYNQNPELSTLSYLVDPEGNIDFPILGKLHVEGMTRNQLVTYLTNEIGKDVKDPIVYISFKNFKITVLGEVGHPGTYTIESEKVNVLQALSYAGDLQLTAQRNGILLLREVDGVMEHYKIDLTDSSLLESPYYYLQHNDILYVQPSLTRVATATSSIGLWTSGLSVLSTVLALVITAMTLK